LLLFEHHCGVSAERSNPNFDQRTAGTIRP
jgi:hypothetical protein